MANRGSLPSLAIYRHKRRGNSEVEELLHLDRGTVQNTWSQPASWELPLFGLSSGPNSPLEIAEVRGVNSAYDHPMAHLGEDLPPYSEEAEEMNLCIRSDENPNACANSDARNMELCSPKDGGGTPGDSSSSSRAAQEPQGTTTTESTPTQDHGVDMEVSDAEDVLWGRVSQTACQDAGYDPSLPEWGMDTSSPPTYDDPCTYALPLLQSRIVRIVEHMLETDQRKIWNINKIKAEDDPLNMRGLRLRKGTQQQRTLPFAVFQRLPDGSVVRYRLVTSKKTIKLEEVDVTDVPSPMWHVSNSDLFFTLPNSDDLDTLEQHCPTGECNTLVKWKKHQWHKPCIVGPAKKAGVALKWTGSRTLVLGRVDLTKYDHVLFSQIE